MMHPGFLLSSGEQKGIFTCGQSPTLFEKLTDSKLACNGVHSVPYTHLVFTSVAL